MRLLTYNIHKGIGGRDRRYNLDRIIAVIEHENPDLICLQEVDRNVRRSGYHDQPSRLADAFNAHGRLYQFNVNVRRGGYGNLLLTRWPVRAHHHVSLRLRQRKARGAQLAVVETPEGPLHLVNWHLGLSERERHWQVDYLLKHPLFREAMDLPTLIVGDTNDWRETLALGPFAQHGFQQATTPRSRFRSFPAYLALGSLDKVFTRGGVLVHHARVVRTRAAKAASDHLPVVVDFQLPPPPDDEP
jgi:endonuclease/exonuclease/phosphatase family metal-dependent hydrolase